LSSGVFASIVTYFIVMGKISKYETPRRSKVPANKVRICVAGGNVSAPTAKAHYLADKIAKKYPNKYETWYYFNSFTFYKFTKVRRKLCRFCATPLGLCIGNIRSCPVSHPSEGSQHHAIRLVMILPLPKYVILMSIQIGWSKATARLHQLVARTISLVLI
jgi:hypothetical protein